VVCVTANVLSFDDEPKTDPRLMFGGAFALDVPPVAEAMIWGGSDRTLRT
jgi:hypothetical protein